MWLLKGEHLLETVEYEFLYKVLFKKKKLE